MNSDGKVTISTALNNKGLEKDIKNISGSLGGLKSVVRGLSKVLAAAFSVKAIMDFTKECIGLGSDIAEVQNVVDVSFGNMESKAEEFANTAIRSFGMSELAAKRTASTYMAMAKGLGVAEDKASDMAISLAGLSGDVASFYNIDQEAAAKKLQGVFTGETEALKELGVVMTQTNLKQFALRKGMNANIDSMSQAEMVALRYAFVTDALSLAAGDFERTQDSWANQTRILSMQWQQFMGIIGQTLTTVLTPAIKLLNNLVSVLINVAQKIQTVVANLFGKAVTQTNAVAESASAGAKELADETEKAGKAAKKALAGFDELNILADNSSAASADGGGSSAGSTAVAVTVEGSVNDSVSPALQVIVDKVKQLIEPLKNIDFSPAVKAFKKLGDAVKNLGKTIGTNLEWFWFNILVPLSEFVIEDVLPRFFEGLSNALDVLNVVLEEGMDIFKQFAENFLKPIAQHNGENLLSFFDNVNRKLEELATKLKESTVWQDLKVILDAIYEVLEPIVTYLIDLQFCLAEVTFNNNAWTEVEKLFEDLEDAIGAIAALIEGDFKDAWEHLRDLMWENKIDKAKENADNLISSINDLISIAEDFAKKWSEAIGSIVKDWADKISTWWTDDVEPWFTVEKWEETIQGMVDGFANCWNKVYDFFVLEVPKWWDDNIAPWFTKEKWEELITTAVEGIKSGWEDFTAFFTETLPTWWKDHVEPWFSMEKWEGLGKKAIKGLANAIIDGINMLITELNKFSIDIPRIKGITEGFTFGLNIPKIPRLAEGAVLPANKPFLAMVGDQRHGTNIEAPLSTIQEAVALVMRDFVDSNMAGHEATVAVLREILEAVLGIEIGDSVLSAAVDRYNRKMAIMKGG